MRRLERQEFITALSTAETSSASSRIIYRITPKGKERWRSRMLEIPNESWVNSRSRFMIKAFFFEELDPSDRNDLIQYRLAQCWEREKKLKSKDFPLQDLNSYQSLTFQQGLQMLKLEVEWLERLLTQDPQTPSFPNYTNGS